MTHLEDRLKGAMTEISTLVADHAVPEPRAVDDPSDTRPRSLLKVWTPAAAAAVLIAAASFGGYVVLSPNASAPFTGSSGESTASPATSTSDGDPSRDDVENIAGQLTAFYDDPGYGKVEVDYEAGRVNVLWKGDPPAAVSRLVGMHDNGVEVVLAQSRYSEPELAKAGRDLADALALRYGRDNVAAVLPNPDRSGLIVEMVHPWSGTVAEVEDLSDYPITLRLVEGPVVPLGVGE